MAGFNGYQPIQACIAGLPYLPHTPGANRCKDLVGTDFVADGQRHGEVSSQFSLRRKDVSEGANPPRPNPVLGHRRADLLRKDLRVEPERLAVSDWCFSGDKMAICNTYR